ncbi:MAG: bifunctional oligoribonuclease/PAP phosphatase NrnA [Firmicutes bacterium]|nr:bifunctional oligoribonuclease/PAP phosphatase NrnA [Bacillota bacterium]
MICPDDVVAAFSGATTILITTHVVPDGDAVGSVLGLKHALERLGWEPVAALAEPVPSSLSFLPGASSIVTPSALEAAYSLAIVLDCGALERVGGCQDAVRGSAKVVNIDHHATNSMFADVNWVETEAAACGEQVAAIMKRLGVEFDPAISTCLYAAIATDTGSFRYSNTRAQTFSVAAELVEAGARPWEVSQNIYDSKPYGSLAALAEAILSMEFQCGGSLAVMTITSDLMRKHDVTEGETEGFIGYARSVAGVEVAVAFRELPGDQIRVGLRSKEKVDVARIAAELGGGGHVRASGCTISGSMEAVKSQVIPRIAEALSTAGFKWTA